MLTIRVEVVVDDFWILDVGGVCIRLFEEKRSDFYVEISYSSAQHL